MILSPTPHWLHALLDGLAEYSDLHPKLFSDHAWGYQKADCPCRLLDAVPKEALAESRAYMDGWRAASGEPTPFWGGGPTVSHPGDAESISAPEPTVNRTDSEEATSA